jgi:UDP-N-acetylglucosamine/UDP-N-acetylgalactosamine diphosphorylase
MTDINFLRDRLRQHGQDHLLSFWDDLTDDEKSILYQDLSSIDFDDISRIWKETGNKDDSELSPSQLTPLPKEVHESVVRSSQDTMNKYRSEG